MWVWWREQSSRRVLLFLVFCWLWPRLLIRRSEDLVNLRYDFIKFHKINPKICLEFSKLFNNILEFQKKKNEENKWTVDYNNFHEILKQLILLILKAVLLDTLPVRALFCSTADTREKCMEMAGGTIDPLRLRGHQSRDVHPFRSWTNRDHHDERSTKWCWHPFHWFQ